MDWLRFGLAWVRAHAQFHFRKRTQQPEWRATALLAFAPATGGFKDVTSTMATILENPGEWPHIVRDLTGWGHQDGPLQLEVRYVHASAYGRLHKYRAVLREGESFAMPPGKSHGLLGPSSLIVHATMEPWNEEEAAPVDVTARIRKYGGPAKDFHERPLAPIDCFPFDDPNMLRDRFRGIRLVTPLSSRLVPWDETF